MRMLFPESAADIDPADVYSDLPSCPERPAIRLNMIVSVDGGTQWNGVSGALGGPADKALFAVLRTFPDVILVASGTMKAEQYGPATLPPEVQAQRKARGQTPVPRIAVVSGSCDFDFSSSFFTAATERPIILTTAAATADDCARADAVADVVVAGDLQVDLRKAVDHLSELGVRHVLAEGGPTLNGQLAKDGLLDELCVTLSPLLASGDAKRLIAGSALDELERVRVRSICEEDDYLFLRYRPTDR